jgi:uncharacterized repeat protein (TIGR03806 family)
MRLFAAIGVLLCAIAVRAGSDPGIVENVLTGATNPPMLSQFGFFNGDASKPSGQLIPYKIRNPLFSDYAEKQRYIYLPKGSPLSVASDGRVEFPIGSALIKNFGYPGQGKSLDIIETRVLVRRETGWVALPYVWRADKSDAELKIAGKRIPYLVKHVGQLNQQINYAVPNKNQCKQCHNNKGEIRPIGPIWQNMVFLRPADKARLVSNIQLSGPLPKPEAIWDNHSTGTLNARAKSYLRANCGYCHSPAGSASNSGLFFDQDYESQTSSGIGKRPVAAGLGSGGYDFVIKPGAPDQSILVHRMRSVEPGVAMPELGRSMVHAEGLELLEQWIKAMPTNQ